MKYQTQEQLRKFAEIHPVKSDRAMTIDERLQRWADLLERTPSRRLATLPGTEFEPPESRARLRADGSPITVAFEDPTLRSAGLQDDSYGEAKRFFGLNDWQLHNVVCYCHSGGSMHSSVAALRVRSAMAARAGGILARLRRAFFR